MQQLLTFSLLQENLKPISLLSSLLCAIGYRKKRKQKGTAAADSRVAVTMILVSGYCFLCSVGMRGIGKKCVGGLEEKSSSSSVEEGVNFAVIGATALEVDFFENRGCHKVLENSLFLMGEIGGNDFNYPLFLRRSIAEIKTYVPHVINAITSAINELINLGARTLMVPGNLPLGCNVVYLTEYETKDKDQYDSFGCLIWLNEFAEFYNQKLLYAINKLRELHPHANIIYADYYNAALPLYHYPTKFGFTGLKCCCGMGGRYNYNASTPCGNPGVIACDDPSQFIGWDGIHLTEAAYRLIADGLINGPHSSPPLSALCLKNVAMDRYYI